ncbi:hypothetical protein ACOME3_010784 [Neoechinorhynchus agilis]
MSESTMSSLSRMLSHRDDDVVEEDRPRVEVDLNEVLNGFSFNLEPEKPKAIFQQNIEDPDSLTRNSDNSFYENLLGAGQYNGEVFEDYVIENKMTKLCGHQTEGVYKKQIHQGTIDIPSDQGSYEPFEVTGMLRDSPSDSYKFVIRRNHEKCEWNCSLISGLAIAISSMQVGEHSEFLFSPFYFYGRAGAPPLIPSDSSALYSVKLLKCQPIYDRLALLAICPNADLSYIQADYTADEIIETALALHKLGNEAFANQDLSEAYYRFDRAIKLLDHNRFDDQVMNQSFSIMTEDALFKLYCNISLVALRLDRVPTALTFAKFAFNMRPNDSKALYRMAHAHRRLGRYNLYRHFLQKSNISLNAQREGGQ